jgi:DNA polymerase
MYRDLCDQVVQLWTDVDTAAKNAIARPGETFTAGKHLSFTVRNVKGLRCLCMKLPSGRSIVYQDPRIERIPDKKNPEWIKTNITFWGQNDQGVWMRISTYGGKLVENATQGTAFDLMGNGCVNAARMGFTIFTVIHDQALSYAHKLLSLDQFCAALTTLPTWAAGLPIKAEGKIVKFYKK